MFVEELGEVPEGSVVIFSAHGVAKSVWDEANRRRLHVIDATCPLVIKVHNEVNRDYTQGYDLILIGHAGHPEVIGTFGQIPDKFHLVSSVEDVEKLQVENANDLSYVTQTTLSVDECRDIVGALHKRFPHIKGPHQEDICYATQNRQNAVKELSKLVDVILVIGSPNSSNSNRLRELGEQCGIASFLIDAASDINPAWLTNVKAVGIVSWRFSARSPGHRSGGIPQDVWVFAEVEELTVVEEDVEFLLPKELITIESSHKSAWGSSADSRHTFAIVPIPQMLWGCSSPAYHRQYFSLHYSPIAVLQSQAFFPLDLSPAHATEGVADVFEIT